MTPEQRKHFEYVRDEMHGEPPVPTAQPEQEPVVCPKCKGLGYYDEGHECDDGTMVGGNYVECEKCKQP